MGCTDPDLCARPTVGDTQRLRALRALYYTTSAGCLTGAEYCVPVEALCQDTAKKHESDSLKMNWALSRLGNCESCYESALL